jgi:hypothetical protein
VRSTPHTTASAANATAVQLWDCQSWAADQRWIHNADNTRTTLGHCLDIIGNGTIHGKIQPWDCDGVGGQVWVTQSNGSLLNPSPAGVWTTPAASPPTGRNYGAVALIDRQAQ